MRDPLLKAARVASQIRHLVDVDCCVTAHERELENGVDAIDMRGQKIVRVGPIDDRRTAPALLDLAKVTNEVLEIVDETRVARRALVPLELMLRIDDDDVGRRLEQRARQL